MVTADKRVFLEKFFWQWTLVAIVCLCGAAQGATIALGLGGSIQGAIDAASPGDVIEVQSGTYHENVNVDKPIILFGVDTGGGKPVVDGGGKGSAISLSASGSVMEGFVVTNSGNDTNAGIRIISDRNVIRDNLVKDSDGYGIILENSSYNIITHIELSGNLRGIGLLNSSNNVLFLNVFKDNGANVISSNSTNQWNSTDPITYRYNGRTLTDRLGNYWFGYQGPDLNDNGIGDVPHLFGHERDDAPLIMTGLRPEITVDKVANVSSGEPGTAVRFTIKVANTGDIEFDRVAVQDLLPDGLEYLGDNRSGTVQVSNVTWDLGSLTVGEAKHLELTARISGDILGNITNHAKVTGVLSREYSLTDEDDEVLKALIQRVMLTKEAEFSLDVIYVVPPPSALLGEAEGNTFTVTIRSAGELKGESIQGAINNATDGDIIEVKGWDGNIYEIDYYTNNVDVSKSLALRGVSVGYGQPIVRAYGGGDKSPITLNANGCVLEGFILKNSGILGAGIRVNSDDNVIRDNTVIENRGVGILLRSSSGNVITGNNVYDNNEGTIRLVESSDNIIYFNNFINKAGGANAWSNSDNIWNSPQKITYRYNGTTFTNYLGNYWSDYTGIDGNGDGIGDTPYNIPGGGAEQDKYPLIKPIEYYDLSYSDRAVSKVADRKTAKPGEEITYTIRVCNNFSLVSTDVVVEDIFERPVEFVSVSPAPGNDGLWRFDDVGFGDCREITLVVKTPKRTDFKFHMGSMVEGEGFVNVADDYSTEPPSYLLINCVKAVFYLNNFTVGSYRNCAAVSIADPGTILSSREHGSGSYESDETIKLLTENKSIEMKKDVSADHGPTALALYRNRTVIYSSRWTEEARAKNRATGASMRESYRYATSIDRDSRMKLDQNESVMEVESEFAGMGHIGFLKKSSPGAAAQASPTFNSQEDYTGSFRVLGKIDEYGFGVSSDRSASGNGFVAVDRRIKDSQRSHESGTGSYQSEEMIRTYTNYIAKNVSLVYRPENQTIIDGLSLSRSIKWMEGVRSRVKNSSLISEEYASLTQLKGETIARGLNEIDSSAQFSGQARYRTVLKDKVDLDQAYAGNYSIKRRVLLGGVSKYDWPHLNLTKTGVVTQKTVVEDLVEKTIDIADYTIYLENDGNRSLGPVYVKDLFPPGAVYISSSLRPQSQPAGSAEWVLTHLAIGDRAEILLKLDVTDLSGGGLVNRVEASGGYNDKWVNASNFSSIERGWISCCPAGGVSASKTARLDAKDPKLVIYNLTIHNEAGTTRVVAVTDHLPNGMKLISSSVPFSSYDGRVVTWRLTDLEPLGTETISYEVEALRSGTFMNWAEIEFASVDGTALDRPLTVEASVRIADFDGEVEASDWQPPDWGFNYTMYSSGMESCEIGCLNAEYV